MLYAFESQRPAALIQPRIEYALSSPHLLFALKFAHRRTLGASVFRAGATQSDGQTSGNDGAKPGEEEFDWIDDD